MSCAEGFTGLPGSGRRVSGAPIANSGSRPSPTCRTPWTRNLHDAEPSGATTGTGNTCTVSPLLRPSDRASCSHGVAFSSRSSWRRNWLKSGRRGLMIRCENKGNSVSDRYARPSSGKLRNGWKSGTAAARCRYRNV
ncbi:hypothetical protein ACFPM0_29355 [Pseudonocardia sulfidoxydans]|uniref:hypothetical protein n=1 Tax=Pseudonocardia sulfidoxydans TaxID=54011 RepID=UPI00361618F2